MDYKKLLFSFEGRINRQPYWMCFLGIFVTNIIVAVISGIMGDTLALIILIPYGIALLWVSLAISVKRWHDRDKSGWWVLIGLIPVIGTIWVLVENGFLRGTEGQNRFGPGLLAGAS